MFNHLIESSSHTKELKRRGSFLLFTTATYVVLFVVTGVVSIYAYDAHLEEQTEQLTLLTFAPPPAAEEPQRVVRDTTPRSNNTPTNNGGPAVRPALIDSPLNPHNPPDNVGTIASSIPPAPRGAVIGNQISDPPGSSGTRVATGTGTGTGPTVSIPDEPPPTPTPKPTPEPVKTIRVSQVLNSEARVLPRPPYPQMARIARIQGQVAVQVLINEKGDVVSAKALSGPTLLIVESQRAALQAKFSPTMINGQAVKVSGVITYNFVLP
ncbi:MAG TPA: energy transducer TonB [Pyrinomonadaceae bacterium]